ncbi:hypothetical protein FRB94_006986 [Tulasnella sp. JGI-2019a]|nr:hypothetical protein FRB93_002161 [Tulasnella sp. JGI-2019a]KAG8998246.1 hypothetical protein FRB94_006986 [Tulasnella sp. JGI-2019a]
MSEDSGYAGHRNAQAEVLTFDGSETSDVTAFLQNVKRVAFSQGRQRDNEWLVDYAEVSLTGRALRWFHGLDEETVGSWKSLRGAFLHRFGSTANALVPAAAPLAAPPRPLTQPPPRVLPPTSINRIRSGEIRKV